jgi:hypothetical protein
MSISHSGKYEDDRVIALMMEAVHTSETSVYVYETTLHPFAVGCRLRK